MKFAGSVPVDAERLDRGARDRPRTAALLMDSYVYAHTNPVYLVKGGARPQSPEDAKYFLRWIDHVVGLLEKSTEFDTARAETGSARPLAARSRGVRAVGVLRIGGEDEAHRCGRMDSCSVVGVLLLGALSAPLAASFNKPDDILRVRDVGSPRISPDGARILYTVREPDLANNRFQSSLWVVGWNGGTPTRLIDKASIAAVQWAPDSRRAALIMSNDGDTQIVILNVTDGKLCAPGHEGKHGAFSSHRYYSGMQWSPDGRELAFAAQDLTDPVDPFLWKDWYRSEGFGKHPPPSAALDCRCRHWRRHASHTRRFSSWPADVVA